MSTRRNLSLNDDAIKQDKGYTKLEVVYQDLKKFTMDINDGTTFGEIKKLCADKIDNSTNPFNSLTLNVHRNYNLDRPKIPLTSSNNTDAYLPFNETLKAEYMSSKPKNESSSSTSANSQADKSPSPENLQVQYYADQRQILLAELKEPEHFLYALVLLDHNGSFDHIFYVGISQDTEFRFTGHNDKSKKINKKKRRYFINYSKDLLRMVILYKGTMGKCSVLEKLLIQYGQDIGLNLTNFHQDKDERSFPCDIVAALRGVIIHGIRLNEGYNADKISSRPKKPKSPGKTNKKCTKAAQKLEPVPAELSTPDKSEVFTNLLDFSGLMLPDTDYEKNLKLLKDSNLINNGDALIVCGPTLLNHRTIPGTFSNFTLQNLNDLKKKEDAILTFATRVRIVANNKKCQKHKPALDMTLMPDKKSVHGYRWRCGKNHKDSLVKNTFLHRPGFSLFTLIQIIFHFSKNLSNDDIVSKLGKINKGNNSYHIR